MKFLNTRLKKTIFWIVMSILILVALIIIFLSPIVKYTVEKYDVKYTGREITMDLPYINPFTGFVYLRNLKVYESKSDSVFFSTNSIAVNFAMTKLLSKTYEVSSLTIDEPMAKIIQNDSVSFNFTDLLTKFASKDTTPKAPKPPLHFNLLDVKIENGKFFYIEKTIPIYYFVKNVNIDTKGKKWDQDTIAVNYALQPGIGTGYMKGSVTFNIKSMDYKLNTQVNKFDLSIIEQYVKGIANYGKFRANIDANLQASGNIKNKEALDAKGLLSINDLHFGKDSLEDYLAFKKLSVSIKHLSPAGKKYSFDSISLLKPYFKYERYDHLDNLENMFGKGGQKVKNAKQAGKANILFQIADYVAALAKNFFKSNFKIQRLAIYDANIRYNDYALVEKFGSSVDPLTILADSIERSDKWVDLTLKTGLKPYGDVNFVLRINPKDSSDFDIDYHLEKIPMTMFNPYLISFTSFPLDRGTLEVQGHWKVRNGFINSDNRLTVIDARINNKQKRNGARWIPLRIAMFLIRDRGNVIDYHVPIEGNLKNPKFKLWDAIWKVIGNLFIKPVTTPYRAELRYTENAIENSLSVRWDKRKSVLESSQQDFVENIAQFLKKNPSVNITVSPLVYSEKEKEYILFFEAKKQFYCFTKKLHDKNLTESDTTEIEEISVKDSAFTHFLNARAKSKLLFTVQDKCHQIVSQHHITNCYNTLLKTRKQVFLAYFKKEGVEQQVKMLAPINKIPYNGFSIYRINYKGEVPDELIEAFRTINEFDNKNPRKKYKELREKERKAARGK